MIIVLPIYYVQKFKRKDDKTWLVGENAYRNWHFFLKNQVKQYYHSLVDDQVQIYKKDNDFNKISGQYTLTIEVYLKNRNSDASNVASRIEKFTLDGLQESGVTVNDNSKYHIGTTWKFLGIDKDNPRCIVTVHPINTSEK